MLVACARVQDVRPHVVAVLGESPDPTRWRGEVKHVCGAMVTFYHFPFLRTPQFSRSCWPPLAALELHPTVMLLLFMFLSKSLLSPGLESFLCCQFGKYGKKLSESIPVVVQCKVRRDPEEQFGCHFACAIKTA